MNLVELNFFDSDDNCVEQYFFYTHKDRSYFCYTNDQAPDSFKDWLSKNHPELDLSNKYEIFYYYGDSIEEI